MGYVMFILFSQSVIIGVLGVLLARLYRLYKRVKHVRFRTCAVCGKEIDRVEDRYSVRLRVSDDKREYFCWDHMLTNRTGRYFVRWVEVDEEGNINDSRFTIGGERLEWGLTEADGEVDELLGYWMVRRPDIK